ncbi:MAG: hypothetical protein N4A49_13690 [Marinifilaceae bacterium]|jgi:hypothetical protein|nr:hypothetical protein [Marinifilaceae bacterium]
MPKISIKLTCLILCLGFTTSVFANNKKNDANCEYPSMFVPQDMHNMRNMLFNIPSPLEITEIIRRLNLDYHSDLLNPVANAENYLTQSDMAINIGIYGADLSYLRIYDQLQTAAHYLVIIKKFTQELGIPEEAGKNTAQRIEENMGNQDSLMNIISETFTNSDMYLKENNRGGTAALIVLGGWIETLYLATNIVDTDNPNEKLKDIIYQQKNSIINLIGLMNQFKTNPKIKSLLPLLNKLNAEFSKLKGGSKSQASVSSVNGRAVIKSGGSSGSISIESLIKIRDLNNALRSEVTEF